MHNSLEVNEYLVKAKTGGRARSRKVAQLLCLTKGSGSLTDTTGGKNPQPEVHTGGCGPARKAAIGSRRLLPPPKHLDISQGAPLSIPTPLSDQFPMRVVSKYS